MRLFDRPAIVIEIPAKKQDAVSELVNAMRFGMLESEEEAAFRVLERARDELQAPVFTGPARQVARQSRKAKRKLVKSYDAALLNLRAIANARSRA